MTRLKLEKIRFIIDCDCGAEFLAEDFEPVCPYCDKKYNVSMVSSLKKFQLKIDPATETDVKSCTK